MVISPDIISTVAQTPAASLTELPMWSWVLAGVAVVIVGIAKSGFGGGVGILAVPLFIFAYGDAQRAVGALLPLLIVADSLSVYHHWGTWDKRNLKVLAGGTLAGIVAGAWVLWTFGRVEQGERWMAMAIGVICIAYVAGDLIRSRLANKWHFKAGYRSGTVTGVIVGVTSTLAHAAGPVAAIYLLGQHMAKQRFIGTAVIFFFAVNTTKLVPYGALGLIDTASLTDGLWLLPLVPLGTFGGAYLNRIMSETVFRNTIMVIILLTGLKLVIDS